MEQLNKETFAKLIENEYNDWCGYYGESYLLKNEDSDDDLFEFVICHVKIDDSFTIEQLDDDSFNAWKEFFNTIDKTEIWQTIDEINNPYNPFQEHCDADFYGI